MKNEEDHKAPQASTNAFRRKSIPKEGPIAADAIVNNPNKRLVVL